MVVVPLSRLYVISSGCPVAQEIERDVMRAEQAGLVEKDKFIRERLQKEGEPQREFYDKVPKMKLLTMEKTNKKKKLTSSQGKVIQYQEQGDIAFQLLVKSQLLDQPTSIDELMTYCITPVPHSLGTPDGYMAKTDKSKVVAYLTADVQNLEPPVQGNEKTFHIEDGNARLYTLKDLPDTFEQVRMNILQVLPKDKDVIFSTDMYLEGSVKSQERMRRGVSERLILEGVKTRRPADFKSFLLNEKNNAHLFELMLRVWSSDLAAPLIHNRHVLLVVDGCLYKLTSTDGQVVEKTEVQQFSLTQGETDTRIILYIEYDQNNGYERVIVRSPDSDVFFILLSYAHQFNVRIIFDIGSGNKRRLLNISQLADELGDDYCQCLLGIYVFTGEDANCAFKGRGKVNPLKKLEKIPRFQTSFRQLGDNWTLDLQLCDELEKFTCLMYGYPRLSSVDAVRAAMLKKMVGEGDRIGPTSKVDLSKLPHCRRSLLPHMKRVNYRVAQWKRCNIRKPQYPEPTAHGWELDHQGLLEPVWSEGPILPSALVEILCVNYHDSDDESDADPESPDVQSPFSSEDESDFD